jgi:microcystin-dependent protein
MSEPFLAEIRIFTWPWAPKGWALCDGSTLQVAQNTALYALLGPTFGSSGNPPTTFQLPDLRGRTPVGYLQSPTLGVTYQLGIAGAGGLEQVTLTTTQIPPHTHTAYGSSDTATKNPPLGNLYATTKAGTLPAPNLYSVPSGQGSLVALAPNTLGSSGGNQGHNNMQPSLVVNFCIATSGLFPPRN